MSPIYRRKSKETRAVELQRGPWADARTTAENERTPDQKILAKVQHMGGSGFFLETVNGTISVGIGDFVAKRNENDLYVILRENFTDLYELAEEEVEESKDEPPRKTAADMIAAAQEKAALADLDKDKQEE